MGVDSTDLVKYCENATYWHTYPLQLTCMGLVWAQSRQTWESMGTCPPSLTLARMYNSMLHTLPGARVSGLNLRPRTRSEGTRVAAYSEGTRVDDMDGSCLPQLASPRIRMRAW